MGKTRINDSIILEAADALDQEYRCFLDYIAANNVKLSARTENLGKKDCAQINQLFHIVKEPYETAGKAQDSYAVIDFFYYFSWDKDILHVVKRKGGGHTLCASECCARFLELSSVERYLLMLTVWFFDYRNNEMMKSCYESYRFLETVMETQKGERIVDRYGQSEVQPWWYEYHSDIRLLALFGLLKISWLDADELQSEEAAANKYRIRSLILTEAGELWKEKNRKILKNSKWLMEDNFCYVLDTNGKMVNGFNGEIRRRILGFLKNPVEAEERTIQFKVSVDSCVRRIKISDMCTLDSLHYYIQRSVDFDMDHLYYFEIGGGSRRRRYFASQCENEEYLADEMELADLHLYEGMHFAYLFDFGDSWRFKITVERIWAGHLQDAEIIQVSGENPDQYNW